MLENQFLGHMILRRRASHARFGQHEAVSPFLYISHDHSAKYETLQLRIIPHMLLRLVNRMIIVSNQNVPPGIRQGPLILLTFPPFGDMLRIAADQERCRPVLFGVRMLTVGSGWVSRCRFQHFHHTRHFTMVE